MVAYLVDCAPAVNLGHEPGRTVVVEDWNGLLEVDLDPRPDSLGLIVLALDELASVGGALPRCRRKGALALRADQATGQAPQQLVDLDLQIDDAVEALAQLHHQSVESGC